MQQFSESSQRTDSFMYAATTPIPATTAAANSTATADTVTTTWVAAAWTTTQIVPHEQSRRLKFAGHLHSNGTIELVGVHILERSASCREIDKIKTVVIYINDARPAESPDP